MPITKQTYRQAAEVLGKAFIDDPVSIASFPGFSAERRLRALTVDFRSELPVCIRHGYAIQVAEAGKTMGAAVIFPPGCYPYPAYEQWLIHIKSFFGNGWYDMRDWLEWLEVVDQERPAEPHFYLEYLGVDPDHQGQGIGSQLVKHMTDIADKQGAGCYLENAVPRNVPFYRRLGFTDVREMEIIGIHAWLMWRPPLRLNV